MKEVEERDRIGLQGVVVCRCDRFPFRLLTSRLLYLHLTIPYRTLTFVSLLFSATCCILPSHPMQPTDKTLLHSFESCITFKKSLSVFIASQLPLRELSPCQTWRYGDNHASLTG